MFSAVVISDVECVELNRKELNCVRRKQNLGKDAVLVVGQGE